MDSSLLNIWRENGAYLRFGDAKGLFLFGVSTTVFASYIYELLKVTQLNWSVINRITGMEATFWQYVALSLFAGSTFLSMLSVMPVLSKKSVRIRLILFTGRLLMLVRRHPDTDRVIYFMDIAGFRSHEDLESSLKKSISLKRSWTSGEEELINQIWIISRIGASKYVLFVLALTSLVSGIVVMILI